MEIQRLIYRSAARTPFSRVLQTHKRATAAHHSFSASLLARPTQQRSGYSLPQRHRQHLKKITLRNFSNSPCLCSSNNDGTYPLTDRPEQPASPPTERSVPVYELTFTCKPCLTRSKHKISKHGYHQGTVLITCPNCKNRHVISDHLKIFHDQSVTVEQFLAQKGEGIKKGVVGENGDIEFWDDGTSTKRN